MRSGGSPQALGATREGPGGSGLSWAASSTHISSPEVPTPLGLLSPLSGIAVSPV